jgi:hypothetical protein
MERNAMSGKRNGTALVSQERERFALCSHPPLLQSERGEDFHAVVSALTREVRPHGYIEEMYVSDFAHHVWEILRLRRCKTALIRGAFRAAIRELLDRIKREDDVIDLALADRWFSSQKARDEVRQLLARTGIGESAIEAEAYRICSRELESWERMLAGLEMRRDNTLARIAAYRQSFARQVRKTADDIIEAEVLPREKDLIANVAAE